jgi:hypothetical protein
MTQISEWVDAALLQTAAESYMHRFLSGELSFETVLKAGNNNLPDDQSNIDVLPGTVRMTTLQAQEFSQRYQVVDHHGRSPCQRRQRVLRHALPLCRRRCHQIYALFSQYGTVALHGGW